MSFPSSNPRFSFSLIALSFFSFLLLSQTVKSEQASFLRLPSDAEYDACPVDSDRAGSCPVKCFRPDPVCGEDGVTYWCGCLEAHCAGRMVVKTGFCEVGSGGPGPLSGQALLLVHLVWLIVLGFSLLCGFV